MAAKIEELISVHEIGEIMAESIINFFANVSNLKVVEACMDSGILFAEIEQIQESEFTGKTFVFTGSWIPLVHDKSDAMFNLGYAMACANYKKNGAYIAMNGHCFADDVKKNWRALKYYKG